MSRTYRAILLGSICLAIIVPNLPLGLFKSDEVMAAGKKEVKFPTLKTPEEKKQFLAMIKESMPTKKVSKVQFTSDDLDRRLISQIGGTRDNYEPIVSDEIFIRRVYLDLTGKIPSPDKIKSFLANRTETRKKRAVLIDELLASEDYGRRWAKYWTDVIFHDSDTPGAHINPKALEDWLADQFNNDVSWDTIVAELVSAVPKSDKKDKLDQEHWNRDTGPNNFVLACNRKAEIIASQTARLFMGISIECAECHDHPFDKWKREQFHELTAFFKPYTHRMQDADDPKVQHVMKPKFLLGEEPPKGIKTHDQRLVAAAGYLVYNTDNYWFARSYVNRMWNELIGDGFYGIDSLGPDHDVQYVSVVNRVSAVFRYEDFNPKWVFRLIMNTRTYQRDIKTMESSSELFTGVRPSRLRPEQLTGVLINITGDDKRKSLERTLTSTFEMDPSKSQDMIEETVQQSLMMMNNGMLHSYLQKQLRPKLLAIKKDDQMIEQLYLEVLARKPSITEVGRSLAHLKKAKNRTEGIDDLIWVTVNSTEFFTKR